MLHSGLEHLQIPRLERKHKLYKLRNLFCVGENRAGRGGGGDFSQCSNYTNADVLATLELSAARDFLDEVNPENLMCW